MLLHRCILHKNQTHTHREFGSPRSGRSCKQSESHTPRWDKNRRQWSQKDRSPGSKGPCIPNRMCHRLRTRHIDPTHCPRNHKPLQECLSRHKLHSRQSHCLRNRIRQAECPLHHKHRTHQCSRKSHCPPSHLAQSCMRFHRCNQCRTLPCCMNRRQHPLWGRSCKQAGWCSLDSCRRRWSLQG